MESQSYGVTVQERFVGQKIVNSYQLIIFDLDGTLVDTAPDIAYSANTVLKALAYPERSMAEVKEAIGFGVRDLMQRLMSYDDGWCPTTEQVEEAAGMFREYYEKHLVDRTRPYPRVAEVLGGALARIPKAVVTNKPHHLTEKILDALELRSFFDLIIGTGWKYPAKPKADGVLAVMEHHAALPAETIMVGDSVVDYKTACQAGIHFAWVNYGYDTVPPGDFKTFSSPWEWRNLSNGSV